MMTTRFFTTAV
ncbi:hypothetical protein LINPERPRIM_LOCUS13741 [Linum perenne]